MMVNLQYIGQVKDRSVEVDHGDCPTLLASTPHRAGTAVTSRARHAELRQLRTIRPANDDVSHEGCERGNKKTYFKCWNEPPSTPHPTAGLDVDDDEENIMLSSGWTGAPKTAVECG
jgi:hypothetical protein